MPTNPLAYPTVSIGFHVSLGSAFASHTVLLRAVHLYYEDRELVTTFDD